VLSAARAARENGAAMRTVVLSLIAVLLLGQPVAGADDSVRFIDEHSGVDPAAFPDIAAQAAREYEKLKAMFGTDVGVVTVKLRPKGVARHIPPAAIVIPARLVNDGRVITAHEITHLLTQGWASALLKEGLAVYAQDRVGERKGWPNEGRNVHRVAFEAVTQSAALVRTPEEADKALSTSNAGQARLRRAAYAVAGSFVTWLIDERFRGELGQFMNTLYRSGNYAGATGADFAALQREWREYVERVIE
jgi:hypothetical protein